MILLGYIYDSMVGLETTRASMAIEFSNLIPFFVAPSSLHALNKMCT